MLHLHRHGRFYIALLAGAAAYMLPLEWGVPLRLLFAGDVFFAVHLGLMLVFAARITPALLRERAQVEDEGWPLILLLTGLAVIFCLAATFLLINQANQSTLVALLAVGSVPLSWAMVHTLAAFHYANMFYAPTKGGDAGGLEFPGSGDPGMVEFLYYAFVVGMTAQVSDVAVSTRDLRRVTLLHGVVSFFYNTVLIAVTVNAVVSLAS